MTIQFLFIIKRALFRIPLETKNKKFEVKIWVKNFRKIKTKKYKTKFIIDCKS